MLYQYDAIVNRVVDGDTVDLNVDLGFRTWRKDRFRLTYINTPERGQAGWSEAKEALEGLIPVGTQIEIQTEHPSMRDPTDKYGRWLATVLARDLQGETFSVNQWMVDNGYAVPYQG